MVHGMHPTLCYLITIYKEVSIQTIVDPRKFSEYLFKEGADHGKNRVFESLGYGKQHSKKLATLYQKQGLEKFKKGEFQLGKKDRYGQRIDIEIELPDMNSPEKVSYLKSGWMILEDGNVKLNTPFTGFTR
jgi:filamentous hemagglutinin